MEKAVENVFVGPDGRERLLRGAAIYSGSAKLAELAIRVGFDTVDDQL